MKIQKPMLIANALFAVGLLMVISSCEKPKVVPESERVTSLMKSRTWRIQSVKIDGISDASFNGMTLSFTTATYSTTNGGVVWPAIGAWTFSDQTGKSIKRNDGLVITIDSISDKILVLSLNWANTTLGGGRNDSVGGKYVFTFIE